MNEKLGPHQILALRELEKGPLTTREVMFLLDMDTILQARRTLSALRDRNLIHVKEWRRAGDDCGGITALWAKGPGD